MRGHVVCSLVLVGLVVGVTSTGVWAEVPAVRHRTIPHVHPANRKALPPAAPAAPATGAGGPAPLGAAGPPPLGAAGPPPLGAAGPPPLGVSGGQPRLIEHKPPLAPAPRCVGATCAGAMAPPEGADVAPDDIPDDAEEMAPGE